MLREVFFEAPGSVAIAINAFAEWAPAVALAGGKEREEESGTGGEKRGAARE